MKRFVLLALPLLSLASCKQERDGYSNPDSPEPATRAPEAPVNPANSNPNPGAGSRSDYQPSTGPGGSNETRENKSKETLEREARGE